MTKPFDPYLEWFGIPPGEHPPNHYRILGLELLESSPDAIAAAANERIARVKLLEAGPQAALCKKVLHELEMAKRCLLNEQGKFLYDQVLKSRTQGPQVIARPQALARGSAAAPPTQKPATAIAQPSIARNLDESAAPWSARKQPRRSVPVPVIIGACAAGLVLSMALVSWALLGGKSKDGGPDGDNKEVAKAADSYAAPLRSSEQNSTNSSPPPVSPPPAVHRAAETDVVDDEPVAMLSSVAEYSAAENPGNENSVDENSAGTAVIQQSDQSDSANESPAATTPQAMSLDKLIEAVEPSVVRVDIVLAGRGGSGHGSGFVVDKSGIIATNYHVIEHAISAEVTFNDHRTARVTGSLCTLPGKDLALLQIDAPKDQLNPLPVATGDPKKGEKVAAFGSPKGFDFTASDGIVSATRTGDEVRRTLKESAGQDIYRMMGYADDAHWIQTTTPISAGNSGGPLLNMFGQVVGLNTWVREGQNLNFAISWRDIQEIIDRPGTLSKLRPHSLPKAPDGVPLARTRPGFDAPRSYERIKLSSGSEVDVNELVRKPSSQELRDLFVKKAPLYIQKSENNRVTGIFTCQQGKLDGPSLVLFDPSTPELLATYSAGQRSGSLRIWDSRGDNLLYSQYKKGKKHGFNCLFKKDQPWLLQEWDKGKLVEEYLIAFESYPPVVTNKKDFSEKQIAEFDEASKQLTDIEEADGAKEVAYKRDFRKWWATEDAAIKSQRASEANVDKRRRTMNRDAARAASNDAAMQSVLRRSLQGP